MPDQLILVRHPLVAKSWSGRCYGHSDMGLSRAGQAMIAPLLDHLASLRPDHIIHSGLRRTRALAEPLAARLGVVALAAPLWRERCFGAWEGLTWQAIYRATGDAMDGMTTAPGTFRPGGNGETTCELIGRVAEALEMLLQCGRTVVVTHGGPIAAVRHLREQTSIAAMASLIVPPGGLLKVDVFRMGPVAQI
jgi:broad specificity phosphatase PhoE